MLPLWIVLAILPILGGAERFNCRGRILGAYYADAKSGCKAFHVCVRVAGGGIRDFRFFCPPGTLFHQEAQTCTDWGDDDPLACPADLYDGQFDLYRIGSGFDTKKLSSEKSRDEEAEFGLQRAETGDRRLSQNTGRESSDLRAAHSSDFFSGQRERGRDDSPAPSPSTRSPYSRQSFRRATTPRATPSSTEYTTPSTPPQPSSAPHYETKRKLVRKRPIYASTVAPTTFAQNTPQQSLPPKENYPQQPFPQKPQQNSPKKQQNEFPSQQTPFQKKPQINVNVQRPQQQQPQQQNNIPSAFVPSQQSFKQEQPPQPQQQVFSQRSQQPLNQQPDQRQPNFATQQQNFNRGPSQNKQTTLTPPANVPPQYKDEYVEVIRVAPKKPKNRYFPANPTPVPFSQSSPTQNFNKKDGLVELYNYDSQSTPGINAQNENRPFKIRNNFNVQDVLKEDFARTNVNLNNGRNAPSTTEYNTAATRDYATSTPAYKNFNSVSYEPEKNNFVSFSGAKQNYFNNPTTTPTATIYTTSANFNTNAYNTNIALNTIQPANYNSEEDDGQYRPPEGEDDGQYRPELYERELLSGAHSLNIAASGNRLPEDQKSYGKSQVYQKPVSQTAAPRPFRPAPSPTNAPTSRVPEPTTTYRAPTTTINTQRTFDYFQTYTTTSRPIDAAVPVNFAAVNNNGPSRSQASSTTAPRTAESRPPAPVTRSPAPPTVAPTRPSTRPPHYANPPKKQEDSSYDYAYYDSDPGFSEYDQIEEFGRTKSRA